MKLMRVPAADGLFTFVSERTRKSNRPRKLGGWETASAILLLCIATAIVSPAQTFTTLLGFDRKDGSNPYDDLVQGVNGSLYGTTSYGEGASVAGTVFEITPMGKLTTVYNFCSKKGCTDGTVPTAGLVLANNGNLYGTTYGVPEFPSYGTVFAITANGKLTTLYSFCSQANCTDGANPYAGLVQATNGNFYGTTLYGGANDSGTVFQITPKGKLTTLYSFCSIGNCIDGALPYAGLVQAIDGNFYGTTSLGGADNQGGYGTVFKITPGGKLTTLYSFCSQTNCTDGAAPYSRLVQGTDGSFYGTTSGGFDVCYPINCGTVFKITPQGELTTLHSFCQVNCADGANPFSGLVQGTDGNFYGTTYFGAVTNCYGACGTVFEISPRGDLTTLYSFCLQSGCPDGEHPYAGLMQATNGNFYGTTYEGGNVKYRDCHRDPPYLGCGTVFSLATGLGPFVKMTPTSGKVGARVIILGTNLTGASSVTFNGTPTAFKLVSKSEIRTTVPDGATTGKVEVTIPGRKLSSDVPFRVAK
jgi:uncharacterized repeat protein (TIGR03803 family)